jgi:hypothetical protein
MSDYMSYQMAVAQNSAYAAGMFSQAMYMNSMNANQSPDGSVPNNFMMASGMGYGGFYPGAFGTPYGMGNGMNHNTPTMGAGGKSEEENVPAAIKKENQGYKSEENKVSEEKHGFRSELPQEREEEEPQAKEW